MRAVAVLAVVLYHAFPAALPGGFIGVDVFFVLSGFLISGLFFAELDRGHFALADFYARRVRRIFPALLLVLAVTLAYGALVLLPSEFAELGQSVAAGAGFASNLLLWRQAGYFDTAASTKPLLHLWSLGVEEQFYLAWPLLLWAVARGRRRALVIGAVALLSFVSAVALIPSDATAAFYWPMTRLWELASGALIASRPQLRAPPALSALGLGLILASAATFGPSTPMPGWAALLPVSGTCLLLAGRPNSWPSRRILAHPVMVGIGLVSYPAYLWHWPPLAFATILRLGRAPTPLMAGLLVIGAFVAAAATTRWLERPVRFGTWRRRAVAPLVMLMAAELVLGLGVWWTGGLPSRLGATPSLDIAQVNAANAERIFAPTRDMVVENHAETYVARIGTGPVHVVLAGDSRLFQFGPRVQRLWEEHRLRGSVVFVVGAACAPVPGVLKTQQFTHCRDLPGLLEAQLAAAPGARLVLGAAWPNYAGDQVTIEREGRSFSGDSPAGIDAFYANLQDMVANAIKRGHSVFLVLSTPSSPRFAPSSLISRSFAGLSIDPGAAEAVSVARLRALSSVADQRLQSVARATGAGLLDPYPDICGSGSLCAPLSEGSSPKFVDDQHLRAAFVRAHVVFLDALLTGGGD